MNRFFWPDDYEAAGVRLRDLPFICVNQVDPAINSVIQAEDPQALVVWNSECQRFQYISKCPAECGGDHMCRVSGRILQGWRLMTTLETPDGEFMEVNLEDIRAWKHACDFRRKEVEEKLSKTPEQYEAEADEKANVMQEEVDAKIADRFATMGRSSAVLDGSKDIE